MTDAKWKKDLEDSMHRIKKLEPIIFGSLGGNALHVVEGRSDEICLLLDQTCGIDYIQAGDDNTYAIASRIQTCLKNNTDSWDSFTVRVWRESETKTELQKRLDAIKFNSLRPQIAMHAYYNKNTDKPVAVAFISSDTLTRIAERKGDKDDRIVREQGRNARLRPVWWYKDIVDCGHNICIWQNNKTRFYNHKKLVAELEVKYE